MMIGLAKQTLYTLLGLSQSIKTFWFTLQDSGMKYLLHRQVFGQQGWPAMVGHRSGAQNSSSCLGRAGKPEQTKDGFRAVPGTQNWSHSVFAGAAPFFWAVPINNSRDCPGVQGR